MRVAFFAALVTLGAVSAAHAEDMRPNFAHTLDIGSVHGVAYYTQERDGYRVVGTLATGDTPVRFVATLQPEQSLTVTVPGSLGHADTTLRIVRRGDKISVSPTTEVAVVN